MKLKIKKPKSIEVKETPTRILYFDLDEESNDIILNGYKLTKKEAHKMMMFLNRALTYLDYNDKLHTNKMKLKDLYKRK